MSGQKWLALLVELFWFLLIAIFAALCSAFLYKKIADTFLVVNFVLAALFAFYFGATLYFKQIFHLQYLPIQILLFAGNIALFIKVLNKMQEMFYLFDSYDVTQFVAAGYNPDADELIEKFNLFKSEFLLFSVGTMILITATQFRLILAFIERIRKIE